MYVYVLLVPLFPLPHGLKAAVALWSKMHICMTLTMQYSQTTNLATLFVISTTQMPVTLLKDKDAELYKFYSWR